MLHLLMSHLHHEDLDREEVARLGVVCQVLACKDRTQLPTLLQSARDLGVVLEQVGSLALSADLPHIGKALLTHFSIGVESYRTTGGERGIDASEGYPLLASLCVMQEHEMLDRALDWGANPDVVWDVEAVMGSYKEEPARISWISEATRCLLPELLSKLLDRATPPSVEEEDRRLLALWQAPLRNHNDRLTRELRHVIEQFSPGAKHALSHSFWDASIPDTKPKPRAKSNLGMIMAASMVDGMNQSQRIMGLQLLEPWLKKTIPAGGECERTLLLDFFKGDRKDTFSAPAWCVNALSPAQSVEVLQAAYPAMLRYLLGRYQSKELRRSVEMLSQDFDRCVKIIDPLTQKALQCTSQPLPKVIPALSALSDSIFVCLVPEIVDLVVAHWPGDKLAATSETQELRAMLAKRTALSSQADEGSSADREAARLAIIPLTEELRRIYQRGQLDAATPARPSRASPRL